MEQTSPVPTGLVCSTETCRKPCLAQMEQTEQTNMNIAVTRSIAPTNRGASALWYVQRFAEKRSRPSRWCNFGCGRGPSSGGFGGDV